MPWDLFWTIIVQVFVGSFAVSFFVWLVTQAIVGPLSRRDEDQALLKEASSK
jgi:hypothetical protein